MADYVEKFGFDVVGAQDLANKLNKALREYGQIAENINKVNAEFNKQGKANKVVVSGLSDDFKKFNIILEANGAVWKRVDTNVTKTVKSLTAAEQRIRSIFSSERKNAATNFLNKRSNDRAQAFSNELGQLSAKRIRLSESLGIASRGRIQNTRNQISQDIFEQIRQSERLAAYKRKVADADKDLENQFVRTGRAGREAGKEVLISWLSVQRLFVVQLLHQAVAQFRLALEGATRTALDYSKRISEIRTLSQQAGESQQVWNKALMDQSNLFGLDLMDITKATYEALSNQIIDSTKDMQFLTDATKLALVTNSDLETSVNALSSVINSFGFSQAETARISAILFKTIDLGKTTLPELAQNLGRVNSLSKVLGVSFAEQQAALSTLTIQGLEDHTAKTLLVNIYQKLIRPTKEMKQIFDDWGVSSGQLAIKTYGLGEILGRLVSRAQASGDFAESLGDAFQELRATTGVATLDLDTYSKHLKENMQAGAEYTRAFSIVQQSEGRQVQIQITKLKNAFIEFGGGILKTFLNATKIFGDSDKILKTTLRTLINLVETYAIYKGTILAVQLATSTYTSAVYMLKAAMLALRGSTFAAQSALAALSGLWPVLVGAGVYGLVSLINYQRQWRERVEESVTKVREEYNKLTEESMQRGIEVTNQWADEFQKKSGGIFKRLGELNVAFTQQVNSMSTNLKKLNQSFVDNIKGIFDGQKDIFKKKIDDLKQVIKDAQSDINNFQKDLKNPHDLFDEQLNMMLDASKNDVQTKIELINRGLRDSMSQVKLGKNFDETRQGYLRAINYAKQLHEIYVEQNDQEGITRTQDLYMKLLGAQNERLQQQIGLRQQIIDKSKQELEITQAREKEFMKQFEGFKGLKKDANIQDFDKMASKLYAAANASNLGANEQMNLFNLIQQHRKNFEQNAVRAQAEKTLATLRAQADSAQQLVNKNVEAHKASAAKLQQDLANSQKVFLENLIRVRGIVGANAAVGIGGNFETTNIEGIAKQRGQFDELKALIDSVQSLKTSGDLNGIPKVIEEILSKTNQLSSTLNYRFLEGGDQSFHAMLSAFQGLNEQVKEYNNQTSVLNQTNQQFDSLQRNLQSLYNIQPTITDQWKQAAENADNLSNAVRGLNEQVLKYMEMQRTVGTPAGGQAKYTGGRIGHYYSGGGTDTQLAYLTPGEYVWDRETTRNMYPFIKGIHQLNKYQGNTGGSTSNNYSFGNINVSGVNGDSTEIAQEVMRTIKREVRRGTFAL